MNEQLARNVWYKLSEGVSPPLGEMVRCYNNTGSCVDYGEMYLDDDGEFYDKNHVLNAEYSVKPTHFLRLSELPDYPNRVDVLDINPQLDVNVEVSKAKPTHSTRRTISIYRNPTPIPDEHLMSSVEEHIPTNKYVYHMTNNCQVSNHVVDISKKYPHVVFVVNERKIPLNFTPSDGMCRENDIHYYRTYYRNGSHYRLEGKIPTDVFKSGIPENIDELVVFDEFDESKLE